MAPPKKPKEVLMAENFIAKYGKHSLKTMLNFFLEGKSNSEIASIFGVSRQRVYHWKRAFTKKHVSVTIKARVAGMVIK